MPAIKHQAASQGPTVSVEYARCRQIQMMALDDDSIHMIAPIGTSRRDLQICVQHRIPELRNRLYAVPRSRRMKRLNTSTTVSLLGQPHALEVCVGDPQVETDGPTLRIAVPNPSDAHQLMAGVIRALNACLSQSAAPMIQRHCSELQVNPPRVRYQPMRTRWGSCRSDGSITLNTWLGGAPAEIIDFIVTHELCHLRTPDHSDRFWGLVEQVLPDYRERRAWLRWNGSSLFYIGAP